MSRRPQHKTRKQLRLETVSVQAELDTLKTPEGLADYLHSRRDDDVFQDAVSARIFELREQERDLFVQGEGIEPGPGTDESLTVNNQTGTTAATGEVVDSSLQP